MAVLEEDTAKSALDELKPLLKPEKVQEAGRLVTRIVTGIVSKSHSGPIPSAEELEHLERVQPGFANRCMEMAEREQGHRHGIESGIVAAEVSLRSRGQFFALIGLLILVLVVGYLAFLGYGGPAAGLGTATIVGVVGIFVTGRYFDRSPPVRGPDAVEEVKKPKTPVTRKRR